MKLSILIFLISTFLSHSLFAEIAEVTIEVNRLDGIKDVGILRAEKFTDNKWTPSATMPYVEFSDGTVALFSKDSDIASMLCLDVFGKEVIGPYRDLRMSIVQRKRYTNGRLALSGFMITGANGVYAEHDFSVFGSELLVMGVSCSTY